MLDSLLRIPSLNEETLRMKTLGWAMTVTFGTLATFMFLTSVPDIIRYVRMRSM